jgi:hypothetical protein
MNTIINSVFAEIANCSHVDPSNAPLRACVDSKVESLAFTGMSLVEQNPYQPEQNKQKIKDMVKQAIHDCRSSLEEVGYKTTGWDLAEACILQRGDRLVDMAVEMMTEGVDEKEIYEGTRKKRCSRRKSNSLKSILRKSNSKKRSKRKVVWKK